MKTAISILFLGAIGSARLARCESAWTYLPASIEARPLEAFAVAEAPTDKVVTVVGTNPIVAHRNLEPLRVFAVEIPLPSGELTEQALPAAFPEGAYWPDASGRIAAVPALPADTHRGLRNPWEVRVHKGAVGMETVFLCGGIVAGGDAGPIAILNGHIVRQGDALGRFGVAKVIAAGVILERNGSYFVIPRGIRTTISTVGG